MLLLLVALILALALATAFGRRAVAGMALVGCLACVVLSEPAPRNDVVEFHTAQEAGR